MSVTGTAGLTTAKTLSLYDRRPALGDSFVYGLVVLLAPVYMTAMGMTVYGFLQPHAWATAAGWCAAAILLGIVAATSFQFIRKRRSQLMRPPAVLDAGHIQGVPVVSRGRDSDSDSDSETISFASVTRLERIPGKLLLLEVSERTVTLRDTDFVEQDALDMVAGAIHAAMNARPDGAVLHDEHQSRHELGAEIRQRRTLGTYVLLGLIAAAFCGQLAVGDLEKATTLVRLGGNAPALVRDGQWWRLVTAGLLHGNFIHFYMNTIGLYSMGVLVEKLIGRARFLIIVLISSVVGNLISAWAASSLVSVGASAGIFGLLGALLVVQVAHRKVMPLALTIAPRRWLVLIGLNVVISLLPGIDFWAHLGGFVSGAVLALIFSRTLDVRNPRAGSALVAISMTVSMICAGAVAYAFSRGKTTDDLAIAVSMKDDAPWVRHELPGFSLEMPPGKVETPESDYGAGHLQVTSLVKGRVVMTTAEWRPSGGEPLNESTMAFLAKTVGASLKATGSPRIFEMSGPRGETLPAAEIATERMVMNFALVPCGQRYVQVMVADQDSPTGWLSRMVKSFQCHPVPDEEAAVAPSLGFPLVLDLPGWYETTHTPTQFVLSDGQSLLMTFIVAGKPGRGYLKSYLISALNESGAQLVAGDSLNGRDAFTGTVAGQPVTGWYRQLVCGPHRTVILLAMAGDEDRASSLVELTAAARCLEAGEAATTWPTEPAHAGAPR